MATIITTIATVAILTTTTTIIMKIPESAGSENYFSCPFNRQTPEQLTKAFDTTYNIPVAKNMSHYLINNTSLNCDRR